MASTTPAPAPWLCDKAGDLIRVPAAAIGFVVRHWPPGSRGKGVRLRQEHSRGPLVVPREVTRDQLAALLGDRCGRFQLEPVDRAHRVLVKAAPAMVLIAPAETVDPAPVSAQTEAVEHLAPLLERIAALEADQRTAQLAHRELAAQVAELTDHVLQIRSEVVQSMRQLMEDMTRLHAVNAEALRAAIANVAPRPMTPPVAEPAPATAITPPPAPGKPTRSYALGGIVLQQVATASTAPPAAAPSIADLTALVDHDLLPHEAAGTLPFRLLLALRHMLAAPAHASGAISLLAPLYTCPAPERRPTWARVVAELVSSEQHRATIAEIMALDFGAGAAERTT